MAEIWLNALKSGHKKKPDASPYAVMKVRPRTCSKDEQKKRPAKHEDTLFLCWYISFFGAKELF